MKILIIIALFIFLKILFHYLKGSLKYTSRTDSSPSDSGKYPSKEYADEIIDVDYEDLK